MQKEETKSNQKSQAPTTPEADKTVTPEKQTPKMRIMPFLLRMKKWSVIIPLGIVILGACALYYFRGQFIVAMVNGQPITRVALVRELEKQGGEATLDSLITKALIYQEADKQKMAVTDAEVNSELDSIEKDLVGQGQTLDQYLASQNLTRAEAFERIKLQKLAQKMAANDVTVSDEEVNDYIEQNKDSIAADSNMEEVKSGVKDQLTQQKVNQKITDWLTALRNDAKISHLLTF